MPFFISQNKTVFVNITQAAKILSCSTRTIHRYIKDNRLRAIRPRHARGVPYCFHIRDLCAFYMFGAEKYSILKKPQKNEILELLR